MHQHLVNSFNLFLGLSMVSWSPNILYAYEFTQFLYDVALKIGSPITQELGQCSKDQDASLPQKLSNSLCSLIRGHMAMCFGKWSQKTKTFTMFGGWPNSIVISMAVKSMCSNSKGAVTMMGCIGTLVWVPSCWMDHLQLLMAFCICGAILDHQNWSCSKYRVCCWPWCLASQWHPFMAATQWAMGDHKPQNFFQFTSWCVVMVDGSLVEHQLFLLLKDSFSLLSICAVS